jgi:hypothetical protein
MEYKEIKEFERDKKKDKFNVRIMTPYGLYTS